MQYQISSSSSFHCVVPRFWKILQTQVLESKRFLANVVYITPLPQSTRSTAYRFPLKEATLFKLSNIHVPSVHRFLASLIRAFVWYLLHLSKYATGTVHDLLFFWISKLLSKPNDSVRFRNFDPSTFSDISKSFMPNNLFRFSWIGSSLEMILKNQGARVLL